MEEHHLTPDRWLETVDRDYLDTYIPQGGASVKLVVADEADRLRVRDALRATAERRRFRYAHVDSTTRKVHLIQQLVAEVALQLPWHEIAANVVRQALLDASYNIPENGALDLAALAEANGEADRALIQDLRRLMQNHVFRNYELSREFRSAARRLANAVYDASPDIQQQAADVVAWLTGTLERVSALRDIGIYRKLGRANARQIFYSSAVWLRLAKEPGLVVTIDVSRYALGKDAPPGNLPPYTKLAALDLNEVLRQFIDATDELQGALVVFLTDERFLPGEERGLQSFPALELRLTDDVRDRKQPNPLAPMVRLRSNI